MSNYPNPYSQNRPFQLEYAEPANPAVVRFMNAVYAWMCVGLAVTAGVAWLVAQTPQLVVTFAGSWWLLFIVEIVLVMVVANAVNRISTGVATILFLAYAALNGLTLSVVFLIFAKSVLASAFIVSAGTFGVMSLYGYLTKRDLTSAGRLLTMALIGLVIASVVSLFWHNTMLQVIINYVGVFVFVGLTAYDTQKLKQLAYQTQGNPRLADRLSIVGSLVLYLDFINLFMFILQLMNNDRRR